MTVVALPTLNKNIDLTSLRRKVFLFRGGPVVFYCVRRLLVFSKFVVSDFEVFMGAQRFTWRRSREVKRGTPRKSAKLAFPLEGP